MDSVIQPALPDSCKAQATCEQCHCTVAVEGGGHAAGKRTCSGSRQRGTVIQRCLFGVCILVSVLDDIVPSVVHLVVTAE
jgi:Na+-transporting NADH:ubiquinone oxidoreductase subunit NqrF